MTKILISYRRSDTAGIVGRIHERLAARYGPDVLFLDIDNVPLAEDFRDFVRRAIKESAVVLAIIGHRWLGQQPDGSIRLQEKNDPVRVEIETAIELGVLLIPVLVEGAVMPAEGSMPSSLRAFPYRNAAIVSAGLDFDTHIGRLQRELDKVVPPRTVPPAASAGGKTARDAPSRWTGAVDVVTRYLRSDTTWAIVAVTALPVAAWAATLAPAWPNGTVVLTSIVSLVTLRFAYRWLLGLQARVVRRVAAAASAATVLLTITYLIALSVFTYQAGPWADREARGVTCTREAAAVYEDKCPGLGADQLREAEFVAERLWTEHSIAVVRVGIIIAWLPIFLAAATLIAAGLASRHRRGETVTLVQGKMG